MSRLKVVTIVGTRPEIIRLSRVIALLDSETDHLLIHTGQNYDYELNQIFFDDLSIRAPDYILDSVGSSVASTIGNIISSVDPLLVEINPDCVLVLGDTNSCLAVIAAKKRKIPVFHMEAGNRCFDQRVPEEINRKIIDHISDINMPYSSIAREYLLREGLPPDRIIKTGSPMFEVLEHYRKKILDSDVLSKLGLEEGCYFVLSTHREENVDTLTNLRKICSTVKSIVEKYNLPVIISAHPRTEKKIAEFGLEFPSKAILLKPLGFFDYNKLQLKAKCVISDSGTISEESSILKFPAVNIREAHERPEAMEEGAVIMTGLGKSRILQAIAVAIKQGSDATHSLGSVDDYSKPNVSKVVLRVLISYTDYINRVVWARQNVDEASHTDD